MEKENKKSAKKNSQKKEGRFSYWWKWPLVVLAISLCLSLSFGILSQYALSGTGLVVSIIVIVVFIIIAIITDMIGVAVTAAELQPFRAMASKKVRGAKESIKLVQKADRVASISADVIGDICSILSGAAGTSVAAVFIINAQNFVEVLIPSLVSAIIASLTIFGKALGKKYAMNHAEGIVLILGKIASIFHCEKKSNKENHKPSKKDELSTEEHFENSETQDKNQQE